MSHYSNKPVKSLLYMAMFAGSTLLSTTALAEEDASVLEEVFVTGSYIKGAAQDAASPVDIIDLDYIRGSGAVSVAELINKLTVNSGSENQADSFSAGGTQGTSNVNLRGLGLSSTLVLINGKRQTIAGALANDGSVFVDTSTVPFAALERIEVLKEGAASTYGSDAVAGVVNFILRKDFDGFEISTGYQNTDEDNADVVDISALWGGGNDKTHVILSASYKEQDALSGSDRPELVQQAASSLFRTFRPLIAEGTTVTVADGPYAGTYDRLENVRDPACVENGGVVVPQASGERCGFLFGPRFNLVNEEERTQLYGNLTHEISDELQLTIELGYTKTEVLDNPQSPSYPALSFPVVPADNVNNPFGVAVAFFGRPLGPDFASPEAPRETETIRAVFGLEGYFQNDFSWNFDITYSENESEGSNPDTIASRFADAINGVGGVSGTETFNLFASTNSAELIDFITTEQTSEITTDLLVLDFVTSGELGEVGIAPVGVAFGAQYRKDSYEINRNEISTVTFDAAGNRIPADLIFLGGGTEVDEDRDSYAVFAEAQFTLTEALTVNAAARYEDLETDSTFDPKVSFRYEPFDTLVLRGSVSTSFREASLTQQFAEGTSLNGVVDPLGSFAFVKATAQGNVDLAPEEATNFNFGVIYQASDALEVKLDYWRVEYEDVITLENSQDKLIADPNGPDIQRSAQGALQAINVDYFNASSIDVDGLDLEINYDFEETSFGEFSLHLTATHFLAYDVDVASGKFNAAGKANQGSFVRSIPSTKGNLSLNWLMGAHNATAILYYVDSYSNRNAPTAPPAGFDDGVESWTTLDVQYGYNFEIGEGDAALSLGVKNLFDEEPPLINSSQFFSYDAKHVDPRGRVFYAKAKLSF